MSDIAANLKSLNERIASACQKAGRKREDVNLLAVGKTKSIAAITEAANAGIEHFGENYLQEAESKIDALPEAIWHFIGGIQSNKTRSIANRFTWVHTLASAKIARRLSDQRDENLGQLQTLIQVNISGEATKQGVTPEVALELVEQARDLPGIRLRGLMAIPEPTSDVERQRANFASLRQLKDEISETFDTDGFDQLSMGMTADFEAAIMEGSTWIRIGTALFGPRQ